MTITSIKASLGQIAPIPWSSVQNTPTTLDGFGITDVFTKNESDGRYVRHDAPQTLTIGQKTQARENIGAESVVQGTGITVTGTAIRTVAFDSAWGDNRYINSYNLLNLSSQFQFIGNVFGMQIRANTTGSSGFPSSLGATVTFYNGSNNSSSANGRTFAIHRNYNSESYYLGSPTAAGTTNPWRLIYHNGNLSPVTTNTEQVITGLKYFRRGIAAEQLHTAFDYPDNSGNDYHLRLYNNGSSNNVRYYFKQKVILGTNDVVLDLPVLGFKNGITLIGSDNYPFTEVETYYDSQTNPATRHPLHLYTDGDAMFKGRIYAGKDDFLNTLFLTSTDTFYSEGTVYAKGGLRTPHPDTTLDNVTWLLGGSATDATGVHDRKIRIKIGANEFDLLAIAI